MVYFLKYITHQTKLGHINAMKDGIPSSYVPLKLSQMPSLLFFLLFTVYYLLSARIKKWFLITFSCVSADLKVDLY